ncbi:ATP-binding protein [Streptomyces sp. NPDC001634]|uniref:ATP-binding protein n=1 Tax=Streptomyces sp. NPDC001634 TaxID=3154390 RepID=UPI00332473AF
MNEYFPSTLLGPRPAQYRMCLTVADHSARHIRRIVRSLLHEWEMAELSDAAELAVTELIANVVRHVPDRRCTLLVLRQTAGLRVEVADGYDQHPAVASELPPEAEGGRGLTLLDAVVDKWGVEPEPSGGKTVWFECLAGREPEYG